MQRLKRFVIFGAVMLGLFEQFAWSDKTIRRYAANSSFVSDVDLFQGDGWHLSSYSVGQGHFMNTAFSPDYILARGDAMSLKIDRQPRRYNGTTGAEAQTVQRFGYGRYEVVMRPAKGSGLVSSFFTYTGPHFDTVHDEIDIEFLGHKTNEVSLNLFTDGKPLVPAKAIKLSFDAAKSFNLYAFEWTPEAIHWYVNSERVHTVRATERRLPSTPSKLMVNIWTGDEDFEAWHGPPLFEDGVSADYKCISFQAIGDSSEQCSDRFG